MDLQPQSQLNKSYLLALNRMIGVGPVQVTQLLKRWPDLSVLFRLSMPMLEAAGLSSRFLQARRVFNWALIEEDLAWEASSPQHHLVTWMDSAYPSLLKEIYDPPVVLYAVGDLSALSAPCIGMVGTRKPSASGEGIANKFAYELSLAGLTVVSGLALGIDAASHRGALLAEGKTIAVMGTGVDVIYPFRHRALAEKIQESGLLLSEFPLKTAPCAGHFPRRNRIISGLSLSILVIEAAIKSGSLITARFALEQNRDVFAVPGSILNPQARGCHYLLQEGAKLAQTTEDILNELNIRYDAASVSVHDATKALKWGDETRLERVDDTSFFSEIPMPRDSSAGGGNDEQMKTQQALMTFIGYEVTSVDQLIARSGMALEQILGALGLLELQGALKAVPGGYMRCIE